VLYSFCSFGGSSCTDGTLPSASLIQDTAGNLYGTAALGGANNSGAVFKLAVPAQSGGAWTETPLYSFCAAASCMDGGIPSAGLIADSEGDLYGTTSAGGVNNSGTVFELALPSFTVAGTAVSVSPGATTGNTSTITLTPTWGFTGSVTLTATITSRPAGAQDPPTVSFGTTSPVNITSASGVTATLTITTTAPTSAALGRPAHSGIRRYAGGTTLAFGLLFGIGIPRLRRNWRTRLGALAFLMILMGGLLACGGSNSGSGGGGGNPGTTPGTYTVTVTGTSGSTTATSTVTLTVT